MRRKLEIFRKKMAGMRTRLQDAKQGLFVVVTVATKLAVSESSVGTHLAKLAVTDVLVNQYCVGNVPKKIAERSGILWSTDGRTETVDRKAVEAVDDVSASPRIQT
jgi:hypothetical protein